MENTNSNFFVITSDVIDQSYPVDIYIAGEYEIIEQICKKEYLENKNRCMIFPCVCTYDNETENMYKIQLFQLNNTAYDSQSSEEIYKNAKRLALNIMEHTETLWALIHTKDKTEVINRMTDSDIGIEKIL